MLLLEHYNTSSTLKSVLFHSLLCSSHLPLPPPLLAGAFADIFFVEGRAKIGAQHLSPAIVE